MNKTFTCIICPIGCEISVEFDNKKIFKIEGNLCKRGEDYIIQEITCPSRTICSSVLIQNGDLPLLSVKTSSPIPKEKMFESINELKKIIVEAPISCGDIIVKNFMNLNCDLIATKSISKK